MDQGSTAESRLRGHRLDTIVGRELPDGQLRHFRIEGWGVDNDRPESRHLVETSEIPYGLSLFTDKNNMKTQMVITVFIFCNGPVRPFLFY